MPAYGGRMSGLELSGCDSRGKHCVRQLLSPRSECLPAAVFTTRGLPAITLRSAVTSEFIEPTTNCSRTPGRH